MKSINDKKLNTISTGDISLVTDSVSDFIKWLADTGHPAFKSTRDLPPALNALKIKLTTHFASNIECEKTIEYLKHLATYPDNYCLFDTAVEVIVRTKRIWHINEQSLTFFHEMYKQNRAIFNDLLESIGQLCERNQLFLQADHIDTVIASFLKQKELPADSLDIIDHFLDRTNPMIESIIQSIHKQHQPDLTRTATTHSLIHHDIPHSLEMKNRIIYVVCNTLSLLATESKRDRFLRNIAGLMIEFHDVVQVDKGDFKSVELATAAQIIEWLTTSKQLSLADEPELKKIIAFMADQIIVLGTTMVFGLKQTTDLSQLFLMIEDASISAGCIVAHQSNQQFIHLMRTMMLVTGVCDKSPSALSAVADMQHNNPNTDGLAVISHYFQRPLLLERFFLSQPLSFESDKASSSGALARERFLITLVPHLCMSAELNKRSKLDSVISYIDFINSCRKKLLMCGSELEFKSWYDQAFTEQHMGDVVDTLFFEFMESEIGFSQSQIGGLEFASKKLQLLTPESEPLIDLTVPHQDMANFSAFKTFYDGLDSSEKNSLINELLLVVVLQAGNTYAQQDQQHKLPHQSPRSDSQLAAISPSAHYKGNAFFPNSQPIKQEPKEPSEYDATLRGKGK